jgi:hypothetical protein
MCPSGNVKVFNSGSACFFEEAATTDTATSLAAALPRAGDPHPPSNVLAARPVMMTAVNMPLRCAFIFCTLGFCDGGLNCPLDN